MQRIFLIGFMGAGKTTLGSFLSKEYGYSFIDLDHYIEKRYFKSISQLFALHGEEGFRLLEQKILHEVAEIEKVVVATGGGTPCFFDNMECMLSKGVTVFIDVPTDELLIRLEKAKSKRPLLKDKNKEEIRAFIEESMLKRRSFYEKADLTIEGSLMYTHKDIDNMAQEVLRFASSKK